MKDIVITCLFLSLFAAACNPARRASNDTPKPRSEKFLMKRLLDNQLEADWLDSKAKVTYRDEYMRESFTATIRMKKDSAIWMSFKKFSIEGARVLLTPDSIFVIDRINNQYMAKPFSFAQKEYHLPVGFQGLQALLLGNPVFFSSQSESGVDSSDFLLSQKTENLRAKYWIDGTKYLLKEFFVDDFRNNRQLTYTAANYQALTGKKKFSYFRRFNLKSKDLGALQVDVDFSKVVIDVPQQLSFSVPSRYERVD